ncbi:hypothetical protein ACFUC1_09880 [Pedococcus sp. NPDC057267]|uniref:hypothetical protein n=1 Tax=Pedococcus sp. NPDC057267 TaxID=3346077 RepID=UPI00362902DC
MSETPSSPQTHEASPAGDQADSREDGTREDVGSPATGTGDRVTGDIVIDSALQDLRDAPADDLDAQIEAGRRVHRTLQGRLSDLGGE